MYDYPPLDRLNVQRPTRHGLFLAAFPAKPAAAEIARRTNVFRDRCRLEGRPLAPGRLHVTLCDLGEYFDEIPDRILAKTMAAVAQIRSSPVDVAFDRLLSFKRRHHLLPLVLCGGDGLAELRRLRQALALSLADSGVKPKSAFTPHMTLLYDRSNLPKRAIDPVRWTVDELVLIDSLRGETRHIPLGRWPLRGAPNS